MAQIRPLIQLRYGRQNEPIRVPIDSLLVDAPQTFINTNTAAGVSALVVKNTTGINGIAVLIGQPGQQGSEIVAVTSILDIGDITLTSSTSFPHSYGTPVYSLKFDQIEYSWSATITGSKSVLTTLAISAYNLSTDYNDTTESTGYYFARFYDSVNNLFSPYSDPCPYSSYTQNAARYVIDNALNEINKQTSQVLTDEFAFQQINNCQMEVLRELKRWSWMQKYDYIIGQLSTGSWKVAVPADQDNRDTFKSVNSIRIGTEEDLIQVDKIQFDEFLEGVAYSTLASDLSIGDTTITLSDSSDFGQTGNPTIGAQTYTMNPTSLYSVTVANGGSGYVVGDVLTLTQGNANATVTVSALNGSKVTDVNITNIGTGYSQKTSATTGGTGSDCTIQITGLTANNLSNNTLTILPAGSAATTGADIFLNATSGLPQYVTTYGGYFYYYPIVAFSYNGLNIYEDYYTALTLITKDSDNVILPDTTVIQYYLQWKFLKKLNNGMEDAGSTAAMQMYIARREKLKQKELLGKTFVLKPRINNFAKLTSFGVDNTPRNIRDANFPNTDF
jgi:hypothetical protein